MRKLLRKIKRLLDKILGTKTDEFYWRFRHLLNKRWSENYMSQDSINHPHRKFLIDKISTLAPLKNVLEIGCASGPNLYLLAKKLPNTKLYGIDISKKAIKVGTEWLNKKGIKNTVLSYGKADNLRSFSNKSIDVVFTDAALIYIGPDKIDKVLKEILRAAKKAIIFNEWHSDDLEHLYDDHWIYNYRLLFKEFVPEEKIKITKLPGDLWSGRWAQFGHIIEIKL